MVNASACQLYDQRSSEANESGGLAPDPDDDVDGDDNGYAVGDAAAAIRTVDGGANWTQAEVPTSVTLTAVCFPTPRKGWAVGHSARRWRRSTENRSPAERGTRMSGRMPPSSHASRPPRARLGPVGPGPYTRRRWPC